MINKMILIFLKIDKNIKSKMIIHLFLMKIMIMKKNIKFWTIHQTLRMMNNLRNFIIIWIMKKMNNMSFIIIWIMNKINKNLSVLRIISKYLKNKIIINILRMIKKFKNYTILSILKIINNNIKNNKKFKKIILNVLRIIIKNKKIKLKI